MTTSPTPAELAALRVANAALLNSSDGSYDLVSTIVFALGSAQLLQTPETVAEHAQQRRPAVGRPAVMETEQAALLAEMLGDVRPARVSVLLELGVSARDQRAHDHASQREDWYCTNLLAFMGERMAPVLRRLLDSEAERAQLRARMSELEANRTTEIVSWLFKKAREYRSTRGREHALQAEAIERMADKISRGAVRPAVQPVPAVGGELRPLLARQREDANTAHEGPEEHSYTTARLREDQ